MTSRERAPLGREGPEIFRVGLGCMGMSAFYGSADETSARATIQRAVDLGVTMFDTADMYGNGANETLVGRALLKHRRSVFVATKFGNVRAPDGSSLGVDGRPEYVRAACDASLKRLGFDEIDLLYQHRVDPETPIEETVGAMGDLVTSGKVRYLGLSEANSDTIERAHRTHPIAAVQTEYSLWTRHVEREVLPTCRRLGIGFVAYSPLGRGFLTGGFSSPDDLESGDARRRHPRFQPGNLERNLPIVETVCKVAGRRGCSPAQAALAWVLGKGNDIFPIPGTKRAAHLEENLGALQVELSEEDVRELDGIRLHEVAGDRYPPAVMLTVQD